MKQVVPWDKVDEFRAKGLNPMSPHSRGLGQFGDTYFANLEAGNKYALNNTLLYFICFFALANHDPGSMK